MLLALRTNCSAYAFSRQLLYAASAISLLLPTSAWGQSAPSGGPNASRSFAIPAQPLEAALRAYMQQSGVQVGYESADVAGRTSAAVNGAFGASEALSRLLSGTNLTYRFTAPTAVRLEPAPTADASTVQLGPVRVAADEGGSVANGPLAAITEGSRSYAAPTATIFGKQATPLRAIPSSVSVITRQRIEDQNLTTIEEALRQATGITSISYSPGIGYFYSRGYETGLQIDGLPSNRSASFNALFDLAMFDRIENLRGPAGIMQGSGNLGGVINLARKRPLAERQISGAVLVGSWSNFRGEVDVSTPLNESKTLLLRVVGSAQDRDFFYDEGHWKRFFGYGILQYAPSDDTTVSFSVARQAAKAGPLSYGQSLGTNFLPVDAPRSTFYGTDWSYNNNYMTELYGELRQRLSQGWELSISGAYERNKTDTKYLYIDNFIAPDGTTTGTNQFNRDRRRYASVDAHISGSIEAGGQTHDLLFGASYAYSRWKSLLGSVDIDPLNAFDLDVPEPAMIPARFGNDTKTSQYGFYGHARVRLSNALSIVGGGRLSYYDVRTTATFPMILPTVEGPDAHGKFSPYAGMVIDVSKTLTLYASYADIFVPQDGMTASARALRPRVGQQYEAGIKGSFLSDKLTTSLAVFQLRDTNRAVTDEANPTFQIERGVVRTRGIEAEIAGSPMLGLELFAGYTYQKTAM